MSPSRIALIALGAGAAWELGWWARRRAERSRVYALASREAVRLGKPLVVVGAPDGGVTAGYGCGDVTVDLAPSVCPVSVQANISERMPFDDNSAVVFVSCVLEYVDDYEGAMRELRRVAGDNLHIVRVEPWTATAYLYPGAKRTIRL